MSFDKARIAIHFSMPLDALDWQNLQTSGARLVQLPWAHALHRGGDERAPTQLDRLTKAGYGVVLRMGREDAEAAGYDSRRLQVELGNRLAETNGRGIEGVIVFNEPDIGPDGKPVNLEKGSVDWRQDLAHEHAHYTGLVWSALRGRVRLCGAPLSNRHLSEDGKPEPGLMEWWYPLKDVYHREGFVAVGAHIYEERMNDDPSAADTMRAKGKLWLWGTFWQPELWIDEFAVTRGESQLERMQGFLAFLRLLARRQERIGMASLFVSNGTGQGYDPRLILREPRCYELVGEYVRGH